MIESGHKKVEAVIEGNEIFHNQIHVSGENIGNTGKKYSNFIRT